ncbi:MAG TPA: hypothetical protein DCO77_13660, partial [Nitrospiraceae bacterium]|nr:hypothetical protein [Nitrospiraceae bacterium]
MTEKLKCLEETNMKRLVKNMRLTKKFLTSILLGLAVVFVSMIVLLSQHQKRVLVDDLKEKGTNLSHFLAAISVEPILNYSFDYLDIYVKDMTSGDSDVVYAVVLDKEGRQLTHQEEEAGDTRGLLEFTSPVKQGDETVGTVKMGFTTSNIERDLLKSQIIILALSVGAMVVTSLIVIVLFRILALRPIDALKAVMVKVASGDLGQSVEVATNDELGELGRATNKMVSDLKNLVGNIRQGATKTASTAEQIAATSKQVKQGAATTSHTAEETLASMEEMA